VNFECIAVYHGVSNRSQATNYINCLTENIRTVLMNDRIVLIY